MAPQVEPGQLTGKPVLTGLQKRLLSAAVLLPVAVLALWLGDHVWAALIFVFGLLMAWEWCAICTTRRQSQIAWAGGLLTVPSVIVLSAVGIALLPWFLPAGQIWPSAWLTLAVAAVLAAVTAWPKQGAAALWLVLGLCYVIPACLAALTIRAQANDGLPTEIWIIALVVAADTGAYVAGRSIGGPKLAPRISPSKTWAGLGGAVVSAALIGAITAAIVPLHHPILLIIISGLLAIVEQAGDLFESFFKRHFGVKDSGRIIPGHGGVLDRVDGLLAVILTVAALEFLMGGGIFGWL